MLAGRGDQRRGHITDSVLTLTLAISKPDAARTRFPIKVVLLMVIFLSHRLYSLQSFIADLSTADRILKSWKSSMIQLSCPSSRVRALRNAHGTKASCFDCFFLAPGILCPRSPDLGYRILCTRYCRSLHLH